MARLLRPPRSSLSGGPVQLRTKGRAPHHFVRADLADRGSRPRPGGAARLRPVQVRAQQAGPTSPFRSLRLSSPNGQEKTITFSRDAEGAPRYRRWKLRSTDESETGSNAGANLQLARYDDNGMFLDNPIPVSRSTGNVTLGPGLVARGGSASASSLSLNSTSLGGGVGVVAVGNAATVPTGTPTGGGVLTPGTRKWSRRGSAHSSRTRETRSLSR
ncbi:hypothetical protein [Streptomyces enissocaesilis]|uniref:Uncharacterized protein n=1 Tax=Streptomyces enissocaesilis TaxID=332589 RepID=A0ABP6JTZ8_9ACTN